MAIVGACRPEARIVVFVLLLRLFALLAFSSSNPIKATEVKRTVRPPVRNVLSALAVI